MQNGDFTHLLNGSVVEEPRGWKEFTEEFKRDDKERIIGLSYEATLTFDGQGYDVLNSLYNSDGHCSVATYEVSQLCGDASFVCCRGTIIIADCKFNETKCEAEASIADAGIAARILNNNEIPISPTATETKNGLTLTPQVPVSLEVFTPSTGTAIVPDRRAWDWYEAIKHAVLYISDNEIEATSAWYEALPDEERYAFLDGNELRVAAGDNPRLVYTFRELFMELALKYDLWIFATQDTDGTPLLRIEPQSTFFGTTVGAYMQPDIQDLVRSIDSDAVYAKVSVGSDTFKKEIQTGGLSLPFFVLRGQTKEEFSFEGTCNSNTTLDLVNEWIIDTNAIEDVLVNANDDYDDDMFLIQYTDSTGAATEGDYLNPNALPSLYNEALQNFLVLQRYDMPSSVGSFYSGIDASFMAEAVAATQTPFNHAFTSAAFDSTPAIVQFDNDYTAPNFDTTNNWGNGTVQGNPVSQANSRYTAPTTGLYNFATLVNWRIIENLFVIGDDCFARRARIVLSFDLYDAGNVFLQSFTNAPNVVPLPFAVGNYQQAWNASIAMNAGDYIELVAYFNLPAFSTTQIACPTIPPPAPTGITISLIDGSTIETTFVTGGGFIEGGETSRILRYEYDRPVDLATWVSLTGSPEDIVMIGGSAPANISTHVKSAKRTVVGGATTWTMIRRP